MRTRFLLVLALANLLGCGTSHGVLRVPAATDGAKPPKVSGQRRHTVDTPDHAVPESEQVTGEAAEAGQIPSPSSDPFGPHGPVVVDRAAIDASWVTWCSPEPGSPKSQLGSHLTLTQWDGHSQVIDSVLAQSPTGGALVVANRGTWQLLDLLNHRTVDLGELGIDRRRSLSDVDARAIAFHPTRHSVALIVQRDGRPEIVVLDYDRLHQVTIRPMAREIYRIAWEPTGEYLFLEEIPADTNQNGRLDWPEPQLAEKSPHCGEIPARYVVSTRSGDQIVSTVAPRTGGAAILADGAVLRAAAGWFVATTEQGLALRTSAGTRALTPNACDVRLVAAHGPSHQLLMGCNEKGRLSLGLVSERGWRALNIDMPSSEDFAHRAWYQRFLPIYSGVKSWLIDFERSAVVELAERDQLLAQHESHVLLRRGSSIVRRNTLDQSESELFKDVASGARVVLGPGVAWVDPYVVSADPALSPLIVPHSVAALSKGGCALSYGAPYDLPGLPKGPMRWVCGATSSAKESALSSALTEPNLVSGSTASPCSTQASTFAGSSGRTAVSLGRGAVVTSL